jgi:hypothetical protein
MNSQHLIDNALFDITFHKKAVVVEQGSEINNFVKNNLMNVIDEVFDHVASELGSMDSVFRIDRLEIDLGEISYADFKEQMPRKLREKLLLALHDIQQVATKEPTAISKLLDNGTDAQAQLFYFLRNGYLPWYSRITDPNSLELLLINTIESTPAALIDILRDKTLRIRVLERLTKQFSKQSVQQLMDILPSFQTQDSVVEEEFVTALLKGEKTLMLSTWPELYHQQAPLLENILRHHGQQTMVRDNIAACFPPEQFDELLSLLEPAASDFVQMLLQHIDLFDSIEQHPSNVRPPQLKELKIFTLAYLLVDPGAGRRFNRKSYLVDLLKDISLSDAGYRSVVLARLLKNAHRLSGADKRLVELSGLLTELSTDIASQPVTTAYVSAKVIDLKAKDNEVSADTTRQNTTEKDVSADIANQPVKDQDLSADTSSQPLTDKNVSADIANQPVKDPDLSADTSSQPVTDKIVSAETISKPATDPDLSADNSSQPVTDKNVSAETINKPATDPDLSADTSSQPVTDKIVSAESSSKPATDPDLSADTSSQPVTDKNVSAETSSQPATEKDVSFDTSSQPAAEQNLLVETSSHKATDNDLSTDIASHRAKDNEVSVDTSSHRATNNDMSAETSCQLAVDQDLSANTTSQPVKDNDVSVDTSILKATDNDLPLSEDDNSGEQYEHYARLRLALTQVTSDKSYSDPELLEDIKILTREGPYWLKRLFSELRSVSREWRQAIENLSIPVLVELSSGYLSAKKTQVPAVSAGSGVDLLSTIHRYAKQSQDKHAFYIRILSDLINDRVIDFIAIGSQISNKVMTDPKPGDSEHVIQNAAHSVANANTLSSNTNTTSEAQPVENEQPVPLDNIYINNAGSVLFAAYLPRLFEQFGWVEEGEFINLDAAEHGVHCVQFLVNESSSSPEYQLVLNKLLCGIEPEMPIRRSIELTPEEQEQLENLLHAITQHWKPLANTSIAGLRESFLQRNGRLQLKGDAWYLSVEAKAFDMLLEQLPWSYSTIKFPWMARPIYTEWR